MSPSIHTVTTALTLPDLRSVTAPIAPEPGEERALVVAAQRGDDEAFSALVRRHQRRSYAVARAIVLSHEDAEDAVQEAFLHAWRALDRFRPDQPFGAWLHRIVATLRSMSPAVARSATRTSSPMSTPRHSATRPKPVT